MKIRYVERKNLDIKKYDACVNKAINSRIYALSSYLDIVADHWGALILEDYKAVMPLPWRSKYFIKYIYPPCWTQQLGVFSMASLDEKVVNSFIKSIPRKFLKTTVQLNSFCKSDSFSGKDNYVLNLNKPYPDLHKAYRKDRKDRLKKFIKSELHVIEDSDAKSIMNLFKENYTYSDNLNTKDYQKLEKLSKETSLKPLVLKIYNKHGELISGSIFFKDNTRIYYVFSANNKEGNKIQGNTAILNEVIKKYAESHFVLDFEGSMIPGIASFFRSFGSELETYFLYEKKTISFL